MQFLLASIPTLSNWELVARLGAAAGLGAALGVERERLDHANPALAASLGELDGVVEASWGT